MLSRPSFFRVHFTPRPSYQTRSSKPVPWEGLARKLEQLARFDVVILNDLGSVPLRQGSEQGDLLFSFITKICEQESRTGERSCCSPTQLPRRARWGRARNRRRDSHPARAEIGR